MSESIVEITHVQEFSASHRLHDPELSAEENRRLYGMCNDLHGHNYAVEVTVRGRVARSGMVMDLNALRSIVIERLIAAVDHKDLNSDVPFLQGVIPTAENVAVAFWRELQPSLEGFPGCTLDRIRVCESRNNFVDYRGPTASDR